MLRARDTTSLFSQAPSVGTITDETEECGMDVIIDRCAGTDIDTRTVKVCVRSPGSGRSRRRSEIRTFFTFDDDL